MKVIVLINPYVPVDEIYYKPEAEIGEHIGIASLASYLRAFGKKVKIVNGHVNKWGLEEIVELSLHYNPILVGISILSHTYPQGYKIAQKIKEEKDIPIVVGGVLPTILGDKILTEFDPDNVLDFAIMGEGERPLLKLSEIINRNWRNKVISKDKPAKGLLQKKDGKIYGIQQPDIIHNLDSLPFPARDDSEITIKSLEDFSCIPSLRLITSRGCYGNCLFCHIAEFYHKHKKRPMWRSRSASNIIDEIKMLKENYNISSFVISDDNFIGPGKRGKRIAINLADKIISQELNIKFKIQCRFDTFDKETFQRLSDAGMYGVDLGVETVEQNSLNFFRKSLSNLTILDVCEALQKYNNFYVGFYMLCIHPLTTIEEINNNYQFLDNIGYFDKNRKDDAVLRKIIGTKLQITKYTRMYNEIKNIGLLGSATINPVLYDFKFKDNRVSLLLDKVANYININGKKGFDNYFKSIIKAMVNKK